MKFTKGIFASFLVFAFVFAAAQTASAYTHMGVLKMGSTGSQVMELQKALNGNGFLISTTGAGSPGMESSYFGAKTKSAVMAFQSAKGLTPVDGIVGINTGAALGALTTTTPTGPLCPNGNTVASSCMTAPAGTPTGPTCPNGNLISNNCAPSGTTTPTGPLAGSAGSINDVSEITSYNNEEVGEGANDVKVLGMEVEATNEGDISISSVKVQFDSTGNSGSVHLDDYIDSVSVWMGSTKVGSADVNDFSESSDIYTRTITLNNAIVRADKTEKFYISVDAVNTFDSTDIAGDSWDVDVMSIRFMDGSGVTTTENAGLGDIGVMNVDIVFVSFGDAADTELKISKDSDSPEAGIVIVDDSSETEGVSLLKGKLKLDGESDVTIDSFPVTFTVAGGNLLSTIATGVTLMIDGEEYSESAATTAGTTTGTITFDDLDFDMSAGDTVEFEVLVDVNGTDDFTSGSSIIASITSDNRSAMDVENEERDQVSDGDKSGTAVGEAQELRSEGINVELTSIDGITTKAETNGDATLGTFTINFKVTAVGDDIYVGTSMLNDTYTYAVENASTGATTGGVSAAITNNGGSGNSTTTTSGGNWKINEGSSVTLSLQVFRGDLAGGAYRAVLSELNWATSDADSVTDSDNAYSSNMEDFKTPYVQLL